MGGAAIGAIAAAPGAAAPERRSPTRIEGPTYVGSDEIQPLVVNGRGAAKVEASSFRSGVGSARFGAGRPLDAAGRQYRAGDQVSEGFRLDADPEVMGAFRDFSRTRPIEIRLLMLRSTKPIFDPNTEIWLVPTSVESSSSDGEPLAFDFDEVTTTRPLLPPWQTTSLGVTGSSQQIQMLVSDHALRTTAAWTDGTIAAYVRLGADTTVAVGPDDQMILTWIIEEL